MYHSHLYTHFADYNKRFYKFVGKKDYYVKVLEVRSSNEYTMEYLDILSTVDRYLHPDNPRLQQKYSGKYSSLSSTSKQLIFRRTVYTKICICLILL